MAKDCNTVNGHAILLVGSDVPSSLLSSNGTSRSLFFIAACDSFLFLFLVAGWEWCYSHGGELIEEKILWEGEFTVSVLDLQIISEII